MPIHCAIARKHFLVVHELLCQEQVILQMMLMPHELYQCMKFAITNQSLQILHLLYNVFSEQIDGILSDSEARSFWETSTFTQSNEPELMEKKAAKIFAQLEAKVSGVNRKEFSSEI